MFDLQQLFPLLPVAPPMATAPRDTVFEDGIARLYRFRKPAGAPTVKAPPVLLVPSLINRWYVLDLREGFSLAAAFAAAGLDTWCLDWGAPEAEDRYFSWQDIQTRLSRMARRVRRETGAGKLSMLGYCMGATVAAIHAALEPQTIAGFINLLGPFDFEQAGLLGLMADRRWFDAEAIADAGNVTPLQMQSGFQALRPSATMAKLVGYLDRSDDPSFREGFAALESWANDNVAFPAEAYRRYVGELYQGNQLIKGEHAIGGRRVDLKHITCPVLTVCAERDVICPPQAAQGLNRACGSSDPQVLQVAGGHVGAVVGSKAPKVLYPSLINWLKEKPCN